jgi:cell division protein FtsW
MLRPGHLLALCVLALLTLGVIMVNSAGMSVDPKEAVTVKSILLSRSSAYMAAALGAMALCAFLPIRRLVPARLRTCEAAGGAGVAAGAVGEPSVAKPGLMPWVRMVARVWLRLAPMWALVAAMLAVMALVYVPGVGRVVNGSHRWASLPLPGLESFQPSELAKWGMIGLLALYGSLYAGRMKKFWIGLAPALAATGAVAAFIVKEDLGTGVLVGLVAALLLLAAGARWWQMALLAPAPIIGVVAAIATSDYRRDRLLAFLNPYEHPQTIGYHMIQSMVAVANGNISGRGLGHGLQKFGRLPEDRTDFLFAVICEELGLAGCLMVVALLLALLWTAMAIVRSERWMVLKLAGLGIVATVGIQAVINLFVVTGLGPTKGIALPLLSSGGTGWILTAASLGLLIAMDRTQAMAHRYELSREEIESLARARQAMRGAMVSVNSGSAAKPAADRAVDSNDGWNGGGDGDGGGIAKVAIEPKFDPPRLYADQLRTMPPPLPLLFSDTPPPLPSEAEIAASTAESGAAASSDPAAAPTEICPELPDQWPVAATNAATVEPKANAPTGGDAMLGSRVTILTSPGQQGWLFSASSAPMSKPRVTLLTRPNAAATSASEAPPDVVVTNAAREWPENSGAGGHDSTSEHGENPA